MVIKEDALHAEEPAWTQGENTVQVSAESRLCGSFHFRRASLVFLTQGMHPFHLTGVMSSLIFCLYGQKRFQDLLIKGLRAKSPQKI